MTEKENFEHELYRKMLYAIKGPGGKCVPVELLMEWEQTRLRLNPNATSQDLLKFENVVIKGLR